MINTSTTSALKANGASDSLISDLDYLLSDDAKALLDRYVVDTVTSGYTRADRDLDYAKTLSSDDDGDGYFQNLSVGDLLSDIMIYRDNVG